MRTTLILLTLILPALASAEAPMEEIIVRGEFRDADVTDVGASVSVLRPGDQGDRVNHLEEVLGRMANVNLASGASRARFVQIRGIGERGQFAEPLNSSVGLLVDGVDLSGIGTVATLHDVEQVEVFRGPQGTLLGANALAGLINVVTGSPTDTWRGNVGFEAADYGARGLSGVLSGPLSERLGFRLSAQQYEDDGFIDNDFLDTDDTNARDEQTVRMKLVYTGEALDVTLSAARIEADNGYDAFSLDNNRTTRSDEPGRDRQETEYVALSMALDVADTVELQGTVTRADSDIAYGYDEDWTFAGFHPFGYSSTDNYLRDRETSTADLRLVSSGNGGFSWVAGVYALRQDVSLQRVYTFQAQDFFSDFEIDRVAVYGELEFALSDRSRLKVGLRSERHESDYDDSEGVRFSPDDDMIGGRLAYEFDLSGSAMLYAALNRGYKAGGFNTDGTLDPSLRVFDPEFLWNVEGGYKGTLLDDRLQLSASLFYMLRRDVQISTSQQLVPGGPFVQHTGNAAEGFNRGVELDVRYALTDALTLFGSVGWLDTEYDDFINGEGRRLDGREQAHAPSYQFYLGADYAFAPNWTLRVEVEGRDEQYFSDTHDTRSDAYELLHASVGYEDERVSLRLWGRNLTDEDYFVRGFFFGNDPRDGYTSRSFTQLGEPARLGVTARLAF